MSGFRHGQTSFRTGKFLVHIGGGLTDFLVGLLKQFRQRKFHMRGNAFDLGQPVLAGLLQERLEGGCVKP